jgi:class 3 adenylate cyclase
MPDESRRGQTVPGDGNGDGDADPIPAVLVIAPDCPEERSTPIYDWLIVGRECADIDERHRLLIDDLTISRKHCELRLDYNLDQAWLTDHSTNGTRLNGRRIERSVPVRIKPGDRLRLGVAELQFRSRRFDAGPGTGPLTVSGELTIRHVTVSNMVMVVGDVLSFSTIAESADDRVLLENIDRLFAGLRRILARHRGTLSNYVGDAFFATWEAGDPADSVAGKAPDAAALEAGRAAVAFAIEAAETVPKIAAGLDLRDPDGGPLRMGWGVAFGPAAVSMMTGLRVTVLGDTTNVAFRLSGIAGRDGWPDVLVTGAVRSVAAASFGFTPLSAIQVKGRNKPVDVLGASRL